MKKYHRIANKMLMLSLGRIRKLSGTLWQNAQDSEHIEKRYFRRKPPTGQLELSSIMNFSMYPMVYNLMSYQQEYNEQPIYELDFQYSKDSESDNTIIQNLYRRYLKKQPKSAPPGAHRGYRSRWVWGIQFQKGSGSAGADKAMPMLCRSASLAPIWQKPWVAPPSKKDAHVSRRQPIF